MKRAIIALVCTAGIVALTMPVRAVGVPVDEVAVPIESITVDELSLRPLSQEKILEMVRNGKTESERLFALGYVFDQQVLIDVIRKDSSSAVRMAAFDRIVEGDAIFRMIFKPGEKSVEDVRLAAIDKVAEIEVVKVIAERSPNAQAKEAAMARLASVYAEEHDRKSGSVHPLVRDAAIRSSKF